MQTVGCTTHRMGVNVFHRTEEQRIQNATAWHVISNVCDSIENQTP